MTQHQGDDETRPEQGPVTQQFQRYQDQPPLPDAPRWPRLLGVAAAVVLVAAVLVLLVRAV